MKFMTFAQMVDLVQKCEFPGYLFSVENDLCHGMVWLQAHYPDKDTITGKMELQHTRPWPLFHHMNESEVVQTVFKCILTSVEHAARERFHYKGQPVYGPHTSVNDLWELARAKQPTGEVKQP